MGSNELGGNTCVTSAGNRQLFTAGEKNLKKELIIIVIIVNFCLPRTVLFYLFVFCVVVQVLHEHLFLSSVVGDHRLHDNQWV